MPTFQYTKAGALDSESYFSKKRSGKSDAPRAKAAADNYKDQKKYR
jgi:hypothetical protein